MILNTEHLNQRMSVDVQQQEIARIQNAEKGSVLFTATTKQNTDVIDTLLHKSGVSYYEGVAGMNISYYKN